MRQDEPVGNAVGRFWMRLAGGLPRRLPLLPAVVAAALWAAVAAAQEGPAAITVDRGRLETGEPAAITIRFPYGCPVLRFPAPPRQQDHDFVLLVEATDARCDERVTQQAFTATVGPLAAGSYTVRAEKLKDESVIASATFDLAAAQATPAAAPGDRTAFVLAWTAIALARSR
jgi:hypothetical protein